MKRGWAAALLAAALTAACAPATRTPTTPALQPPEFPLAAYIGAQERGEAVFRFEPDSLATIRVYRTGALARLGHDHVVASRNVQGFLRGINAAPIQADFYVPLDALRVDEPALRTQAGFDTQPSQADVDGTYRNMADKVLEIERFPFARFHVVVAENSGVRVVAQVDMTLHGTTRTFTIPLEVEWPSVERFYASGRFSVNQTDFGIKPYSVFGGALQVQDRIDIDFRLHGLSVPRDKPLTPLG